MSWFWQSKGGWQGEPQTNRMVIRKKIQVSAVQPAAYQLRERQTVPQMFKGGGYKWLKKGHAQNAA